MDLTIYATIPSSRLTFEQASQIIRECSQLGITADFENYTGRLALSVSTPMQHEALRIIEDNKAILTDVRGDGQKSFSEFFGTKVPLDSERAAVYCDMCEEGRIW